MNKPDEYEKLERAHAAAGLHMMQASPRADELIACLESEISKRDARIVELELTVFQLNNSVTSHHWENTALRAELAAIKAQEPVAEIALSDDGYKIGLLGALRNHRLPIGTKLYAAPVSEAKAQGVVMPPSPYMPDVEPAMLSDYERGEAQGRCDMWSEVARLNAAPAAPAADAGLVEALCHISLCSNNSMSSKSDCGKIARAALAAHRAAPAPGGE